MTYQKSWLQTVHNYQPFMSLQADGLKFLHFFLSCDTLIHVTFALSSISSLHLCFGFPLFLVLPLGIHSVTFFAHLLLSILAMCSDHFHFNFSTFSRMSTTPVCSLTVAFCHLSLVVLSIDLSILLCATASFFLASLLVFTSPIHILLLVK